MSKKHRGLKSHVRVPLTLTPRPPFQKAGLGNRSIALYRSCDRSFQKNDRSFDRSITLIALLVALLIAQLLFSKERLIERLLNCSF